LQINFIATLHLCGRTLYRKGTEMQKKKRY